MPNIDLSILNQRQTPAFFADTLANRPAAGFLGRIFVSTNTFAFYRDNGTSWDLIGGPGTGTITGTGTAGTIPLWNGASSIGNSDLRQLSSEALILNSATDDWPTSNFANDAGRFLITSAINNPSLILWGKSAFGSGDEQGSIALGSLTTLGANTFGGSLIEGSIENGTDRSGKFNIYTTDTSGTQQLALTINSTQNTIFNNSIGINTSTPGAAIDVHSSVNIIQQLNQTIATNNSLLAFQNSGTGLWRIGNFYNLGANDWGIFDVVGAAQPFTIKKTTGQTFIGAETTTSGRLVVNNATGDNHIVVIGATAPSIRINNSGSGATRQIGIGLATTTNNFIQGTTGGEMAIFNSSTTASPILFGVYDAGLSNTQEAARISAVRNFLIGGVSDAGQKLQVAGNVILENNITINARTDNFGELIYRENSVLKWNLYNDYTTDQFKIGNSGGTIFSLTQGGAASFSSSINAGSDITLPDGNSLRSSGQRVVTRTGNEIRLGSGSATDFLAFYSGATQNATLTSSGSFLVNTTTSQIYSKLVVAGGICYNNNQNQAVADNTYGMSFAKKINVVSNSGANTIYSQAGSEGALYTICGLNTTSGARFVDLVLYLGAASTLPIVVSSQIFGTVSARTYTNVSESLTLSLVGDTNTYEVRMTAMGCNERT